MLLKALRRHADIPQHMARVPTEKLLTLLLQLLNWTPEDEIKSHEAKEIALRSIANLALNPRYKAQFTNFGEFFLS